MVERSSQASRSSSTTNTWTPASASRGRGSRRLMSVHRAFRHIGAATIAQRNDRLKAETDYNRRNMSRALIALIVIVVVIGGLVVWAVGINNQLVVQEQNVNSAWA